MNRRHALGRHRALYLAEQRLSAHLLRIEQTLGEIMSQQADIDNAVTALGNLGADIKAQVTAIGADISAIKAAVGNGTAVNTTALVSAVASLESNQADLDSSVSSLTAAIPAPVTPVPPVTPPAVPPVAPGA